MATFDNIKKIAGDFRGLGKLWPWLRVSKGRVFFALGLIPLIAALQTSVPLIIKDTIDRGVQHGRFDIITTGAIIFFVVVVCEYAGRSGQALLMALSVHRMIRDLRLSLVRHIMKLSARFHDHSLSGALVTRATSDFDNLSESLNQGVLTALVDMSMLVGAVIGLLILDWQLALCIFMVLPVVAVVVTTFSRLLKRAMLNARSRIAALNAYNQECLYGASTIKLLAAEEAAEGRITRLAKEYRNAQMTSVILDALMFSTLDGMAVITMGVFLWVALAGLAGEATLTPGLLVAFIAYINAMFEPLKQLGNKMAMMQGAFTSIDRIFGIMETRDFVAGQDRLPSIAGHIEFDHVSFSYGGRPQDQVLHDISFELNQGESMAIVGSTGSGKSTIIKLISKLYDGYEGCIRLDGTDLREFEGSHLRRMMSIVPQDIVLFDGTVAFNISLGQEEISRSDVEEACRLVGADHFIRQLPGGYDATITEGGQNLSQGQRQLIAFARALARDPGLIILDEATASVDPESETFIQRAISRVMESRTVIVIAHRLSTIRSCDQIMVIERGKVQESGNHTELLQRQGAYHRLYHALLTREATGTS